VKEAGEGSLEAFPRAVYCTRAWGDMPDYDYRRRLSSLKGGWWSQSAELCSGPGTGQPDWQPRLESRHSTPRWKQGRAAPHLWPAVPTGGWWWQWRKWLIPPLTSRLSAPSTADGWSV